MMKNLAGKLKLKKHFLLVIFLSIIFLLLIPTNNAHAFSFFGIEDIASDAFFSSIGWVVNLISKIIGATLLPLAANLLNWIFEVGKFTTAPVVVSGWAISRDIANMGFILVLLFIGFATILKLNTYGIKQLLPKLIMIALLINFSLVIGGVFIDMGNDIGRFFVSGGSEDTTGVGDNIMAAVALTRTIQPNTDALSVEELESDNLLIKSLGALAMTIVVTFLLSAMVLIMFFRMIFLWILLILAPLAWIAYVIPHASQYWSQWWTKFLQWSFFPAIFGFFIYLGVFTGLKFSAPESFGSIPTIPAALTRADTLPFQSITTLLQYTAVIFILFFGLIAAQKWSLAGASTAMKLGNTGKNWMLGKVKGGTIRGAKLAGKAAVRAVPEERRRAVRETLEKIPLVGRAIGGPGARHAAQQKMLKEQRGKMKNLRPQDYEAILKQTVATPEGLARRAGALAELAEKGKLKDEHKKYFGNFLNASGKASDVLQSMPAWALDENIQNTLARNPATKEEWTKIIEIENPEDRRNKALKAAMPKEAKDFAKIQRVIIDIEDEKLEKLPVEQRRDEINRRQAVLDHVIERFKKGGDFHGNHLTALANKNQGSYEVIREKLEEIKDDLQPGVKKYLESGPGFVTFTEAKEEPAAGTTEATPA